MRGFEACDGAGGGQRWRMPNLARPRPHRHRPHRHRPHRLRPFVPAARGLALAGLVLALAIGPAAAPAGADDPDFLSGAVGWYDVGGDDQAAEFRLEYRSDLKLWIFKPYAAVAGTTTGSVFVGGGLLADIYFGDRFVLTGSAGVNYYANGSARLDLGHEVEFRTQAELAYRFDDRSRVGIAFSHYSNAGIGDRNPGVETLSLYYSIPLQW